MSFNKAGFLKIDTEAGLKEYFALGIPEPVAQMLTGSMASFLGMMTIASGIELEDLEKRICERTEFIVKKADRKQIDEAMQNFVVEMNSLIGFFIDSYQDGWNDEFQTKQKSESCKICNCDRCVARRAECN